MDIKDFIFKHIEKFIFCITACYLIYTGIHTFIILNIKTLKFNTKLQALSNDIERKLGKSIPPIIDTKLKNVEQLELRFTTPPDPNLLNQPQIFSRVTKGETISDITTRDSLKKSKLQTHPHLEVTTPGDTEVVFKGGTAELVLIQVRKLYKDTWWTKSFIVEKGKTVGEKRTMGRETVDFDTHCKLIEIIPLAQKPFVIKKTIVLRDERGEFLGTSLTEETHMVSTSKIVFEYKNGKSYDLWIGEFVNLGTETVTVHSATNASLTN